LTKNNENTCESCVKKCEEGYLYLKIGEIVNWIDKNTSLNNQNITLNKEVRLDDIKTLLNTHIVNTLKCKWCKAKQNILKEKIDIDKKLDEKWFHTVMSTFVLYTYIKNDWEYIYYIPASLPDITVGGFIIQWKGKSIQSDEGTFLKTLALEALSYPILVEKEALSENLGKGKGASDIAASVAHNLRNILPGFTSVIESISTEYPRLFIQGHAVENRINWLNILNPKVNLMQKKQVNLINILLSSFNSAWLLILLRGEIVNHVDMINKFKKENHILYPVLSLKTNSNNYNFVTESFVTKKRKVSFLEIDKWGDCNVPKFNEHYYKKFNQLYRYSIDSKLQITLISNKPLTLIQNMNIPKEAVSGIEGSIEEIFFNALKYGKKEEPVCIYCNLTNEEIEIYNLLPDKYEQNKKGGGLVGNEVFYRRIGWSYSGKPENGKFVNKIQFQQG
jgi:hypothetical protein